MIILDILDPDNEIQEERAKKDEPEKIKRRPKHLRLQVINIQGEVVDIETPYG